MTIDDAVYQLLINTKTNLCRFHFSLGFGMELINNNGFTLLFLTGIDDSFTTIICPYQKEDTFSYQSMKTQFCISTKVLIFVTGMNF